MTNGVIYFPPGLYRLESPIVINKSNIVLRGAEGTIGTLFYMPYSAEEFTGTVDPNFGWATTGPMFRVHIPSRSVVSGAIEPSHLLRQLLAKWVVHFLVQQAWRLTLVRA